MIFSPWPMILRSLPMMDFSPLEGALMDGCALLVLPGRVLRGSSVFGSADELRVNIEAPKVLLVKPAPTATPDQAPCSTISNSSSCPHPANSWIGCPLHERTVAIMARADTGNRWAARRCALAAPSCLLLRPAMP